MTGKELAAALIGAALVGGVAGAAASLAMAPKEHAQPQPAADVVGRLTAAEADLAKARTSLDESRQAITDLTERVTRAELSAAKSAGDAKSAPTTGRSVRVGRRAAAAAGGAPQTEATNDADVVALDGIQIDPGELGAAFGKALEGAQIGAAGSMESLQAGLELRKLPEDQRWQKAKDDLGLTWNQVEDLKKAVADRDAATKAAMTSEKKDAGNGGSITISRPDEGKLAHAQADYHDRVNAALSEDQKKTWQSKGYDHEFGSGGFGGGMVMSISVATDKAAEPAKK